MAIPSAFNVDFSAFREKDLIQQAINRMLGQHYDKCMIKQCVLALMGEVQCLYDALIDLQEQRTLYRARGETLNALGRIVGEERTGFQHDDSGWMAADRPGQVPDKAACWSLYGKLGEFVSMGDEAYASQILWRIAKNHTLAASVPEISSLVRLITERDISFEKTGPMQVTLLCPADLAATAWVMLTQARNDQCVDSEFLFPYPATLYFYTIVTYNREQPENLAWFCADRSNLQCCDSSPCAVGIPLPDYGTGGGNLMDPDTGGTGAIYLPEHWLCADREDGQQPDEALCATGVPIQRA